MTFRMSIGWDSRYWKHYNNLSIVRAGVYISEPSARTCAFNAHGCANRLPGFNVEYFERLMMRVGLKYELVRCGSTQFNTKAITGCARDLINNKIDAFAVPILHNSFRDQYVDYVLPVINYRFGALTKLYRSHGFIENISENHDTTRIELLGWLMIFFLIDFIAIRSSARSGQSFSRIIKSVASVAITTLEVVVFVIFCNLMKSAAMDHSVVKPFSSFTELIDLLTDKQRFIVDIQSRKRANTIYWEYLSPLLTQNPKYYAKFKNYLFPSSGKQPVRMASDYGDTKSLERILNDNLGLTMVASEPTVKFNSARHKNVFAVTVNPFDSDNNRWYSITTQNCSRLTPIISDGIRYGRDLYFDLLDKYTSIEPNFGNKPAQAEPYGMVVLHLPALILLLGNLASVMVLIFETCGKIIEH